jgi:2-keto-4-pentenoate hydratase/2-oxohepta-3-ene-1,7-dioic acid hydratase in catechol pathway
MRLASFAVAGIESFGAVVDGGVVDLGKRSRFTSILDVLASDGVAEAARLSPAEADYPLADVSWRHPVIGMEKIICVGINYPEPMSADRGPGKAARYPNLFVRFPSSFAAHKEPIVRPAVSGKFDYEGEIAVVIGHAGRHVARERANDYIAGFTIANEGTVRDWVNHGTKNVTQGKNFDRSGAIGPWLVTADELSPAEPQSLVTRVNGAVRQKDSSARMFWRIDELISYISEFTTLRPGDIILTGTPSGVGDRLDPPTYLRAGDAVEVEVAGIGVLANRVEDEVA